MSANINVTNGVARMAYAAASGTPWHGMGKAYDRPMTSDDLIGVGGPFYGVTAQPCEVFAVFHKKDGTTVNVPMPNDMATVREDTINGLGVVGVGYGLIQIPETLHRIDALYPDSIITYDTAGLLGRGERWWALANIKSNASDMEPISKAPGDTLKPYLLMCSSFDGGSLCQAFFTAVRAVCQNTIAAAISENVESTLAGFRHSSQIKAHLDERFDLIADAVKRHHASVTIARRMAKVQMTQAQVDAFLLELDPKPVKVGTGKNVSIWQNRATAMLKNIEAESDVQGSRNLWATFNGISGFIQHGATFRATLKGNGYGYTAAENRFQSIIGGTAMKDTSEVYSTALVFGGIAKKNDKGKLVVVP